MTFEEAVKKLADALESRLQDVDDEELQEVIEDIITDYYGFDFGDDSRTDDEEILLEDLAWAQVGSMALLKIAAEWASRTPVVRHQVDVPLFKANEVWWRNNLWRSYL